MCFCNNQQYQGGCCYGLRGPTGVQGPAGTITIGTVTTGAPGTEASVTNVGTAQNAILDFVIPQGATGTEATSVYYAGQNQTGLTAADGTIVPMNVIASQEITTITNGARILEAGTYLIDYRLHATSGVGVVGLTLNGTNLTNTNMGITATNLNADYLTLRALNVGDEIQLRIITSTTETPIVLGDATVNAILYLLKID